MNSAQRAHKKYCLRNRENIIEQNLNYYYENRDKILERTRRTAAEWYQRIKTNSSLYRKRLIHSNFNQKHRRIVISILKRFFHAWSRLLPISGSRVVDKILVEFS